MLKSTADNGVEVLMPKGKMVQPNMYLKLKQTEIRLKALLLLTLFIPVKDIIPFVKLKEPLTLKAKHSHQQK